MDYQVKIMLKISYDIDHNLIKKKLIKISWFHPIQQSELKIRKLDLYQVYSSKNWSIIFQILVIEMV